MQNIDIKTHVTNVSYAYAILSTDSISTSDLSNLFLCFLEKLYLCLREEKSVLNLVVPP